MARAWIRSPTLKTVDLLFADLDSVFTGPHQSTHFREGRPRREKQILCLQTVSTKRHAYQFWIILRFGLIKSPVEGFHLIEEFNDGIGVLLVHFAFLQQRRKRVEVDLNR